VDDAAGPLFGLLHAFGTILLVSGSAHAARSVSSGL
jgi:hypothetical protein